MRLSFPRIAAAIVSASAAGAQSPVPPDTLPVALTVSGGVSLGAYQAGVTWALVRYWEMARDPAFRRQFTQAKRPFQLVSATGASAGNINAVLAALDWCDARSDQPPDSSLLWTVWVRTGFEELLDEHVGEWDHAHAAQPGVDKALLGREYFYRQLLPQFQKVTKTAGATETGCNVPIGITLTRIEPEEITIAGDVRAANQRFASVVVARPDTGGAGIAFHQPWRPIRSDRAFGTLIALADTTGSALVPARSVFDLIQASSAFPIAFSPVELAYYPANRLTNDASGATDATCPRANASAQCLEPARHLFMDGGVFDNTPLGFARRLAIRRRQVPSDTLGLRIAYVDAGLLRGTLGEFSRRGRPAIPSEGVATLLAFSRGVVPSARQYELQMLRRVVIAENEGRATERAQGGARRPADVATRNEGNIVDTELGTLIRPTSRGRPIMGERLLAFGAFLAQPLREHDFYVGVYDGLRYVAREYNCAGDASPDEACVSETVRDLIGDTDHMRLGPVARFTVRHALARESGDEHLPRVEGTSDALETKLLTQLLALNDTLIRRTEAPDCAARSHPVEVIACREYLTYLFDRIDDSDTHGAVKARRDSVCGGRSPAWSVLWWVDDKERALTGADSARSAECWKWKHFERLIQSPRVHLNERLQSILRQLWRVEDYRADLKLENWETPIELAEFAYLSTAERFRRGLMFDPSTIPSYEDGRPLGLLQLLPYQASTGVGQTGVMFGWRPTLYQKHDWKPFVSVDFARLHRTLPGDDTYRWHVWPGIGVQGHIAGTTLAHKAVTGLGLLNPLFVAAHTSASFADGRRTFRHAFDLDRVGFEVGGYAAAGKLKLAMRFLPRTLERANGRGGRFMATVGVADLNGLLYWGTRLVK